MNNNNHDEYLSVEEFTEFLGVTKPTVYKWLKLGMPHIQVEGRGVIKILKFRSLNWLENSTPKNVKRMGS